MDKNTNRGAGVKSVEKRLESKDDLLGSDQELRRLPLPPLSDELGGGIWTGMPASHEIGGCLRFSRTWPCSTRGSGLLWADLSGSSFSPAGTAAIRSAYVHAPKAANTLVLCRTSTWRNPTLRSRSSWYISGRGVSSRVT